MLVSRIRKIKISLLKNVDLNNQQNWAPTNNHHTIKTMKQRAMKSEKKSKKHDYQNIPT